MFLLTTLAILGCTPHLYSDSFGDTSDSSVGWSQPDNSWETLSEPPENLEAEGFGVGQVVPDIRLQDQHGKEVSLWQFYGMVIALDVSTVWCAPCRDLAVGVDETWHEYKDQGFVYVTMMPEDNNGEIPSTDVLQTWASDYSITAPILSDSSPYENSYTIVPDGVNPSVMVIDRGMKVQTVRVNPSEDYAVRAAVASAL